LSLPASGHWSTLIAAVAAIKHRRAWFMTQTAQMPMEPQRLRALEHANAVRLARAELKRKIAEGDASAAEVILECPEAVRKWTVAELLMSQRRWGTTRCRKFLERNGVSEIKAIGALTDRQRHLLAEQLNGGCPLIEDSLTAERKLALA
jgi:hypothetical protein